jgi:hypothetical protein
MKLCKDCRWILPPDSPDSIMGPSCGHQAASYKSTSFVDGSITQHRWSCESFRALSINCGPNGKHWEPKENSGGFV